MTEKDKSKKELVLKKLVLEQVEESTEQDTEKVLNNLEEGDYYKGFRVESLEEVECDHPRRRYSFSEQRSDTLPEVHGKCTVCGDEKRFYLTDTPPL